MASSKVIPLQALYSKQLTTGQSSNCKNSVTVAYTDFAKAFDTVCHNKLLHKLSAYGITGNLLQWIESFRTGRSQQTRVSQSFSNVTNLFSGVVQGSVLGPLLFVIFINDIVTLFDGSNCKCKLYADDLKLYTELQTDADHTILQGKLNDVYCWSAKWQLSISYKKCNILCVGSHVNNIPSMQLNNNILEVLDEAEDLGITIDSNLTFKSYINGMVARAFTRSKLIS